MNFKVGDKVRCIDNKLSNNELKLGQTYIIVELNEGEVRVIGNHHTWWSKRFAPLSILELEASFKLTTLPTDSSERKNYPMLSGCLKYFPAALAGVAKVSKLGNDKHNPGEPLHHAREKSTDHGDCIVRHLTDAEDLLAAMQLGSPNVTPQQILLEVSQLAWRALAYSQLVHEKFGAPLAPGASKPLNSGENK